MTGRTAKGNLASCAFRFVYLWRNLGVIFIRKVFV